MRMGLGSLQYLVPSCWNCLERIRKCGFDGGGVILVVELSLGAGVEVSFTLLCVALPEDWGSIPSAYMMVHSCL